MTTATLNQPTMIESKAARRLKSEDIVTGQRIENEAGFWAVLKFDPQGGRWGYGVWYVETYAPHFPDHIPSFVSTSNQHRSVCEKHVRSWLRETA